MRLFPVPRNRNTGLSGHIVQRGIRMKRSLRLFARLCRCFTLCLSLLSVPGHALAATHPTLSFEELYSSGGVLGLEFSDKVKRLSGGRVVIQGFMAPPLKAEADFFVLTREPVALCPFCQSDADWPDNILVVYLGEKQQFVQNNATIEVEGVLETGSRVDPNTGFVSQLRLRDASFRKL